MRGSNDLGVVVLIGPGLANRNTLAVMINPNVNVVGAVRANQRKWGVIGNSNEIGKIPNQKMIIQCQK